MSKMSKLEFSLFCWDHHIDLSAGHAELVYEHISDGRYSDEAIVHEMLALAGISNPATYMNVLEFYNQFFIIRQEATNTL